MAGELSPRGEALQKFVELFSTVRSGAYKMVKRGVVNWATFAWAEFPRAVTIAQDETSLLRSDGRNDADITIEVMAKTPEPKIPRSYYSIDDVLEDEMIFDLQRVVEHFQAARSSNPKYPVAFKVITENARIVEVHDSVLRVQGIICPLTIGF